MNETTLMVAFHTQRLKDSIGGGVLKEFKCNGRKDFFTFRPDERETGMAE